MATFAEDYKTSVNSHFTITHTHTFQLRLCFRNDPVSTLVATFCFSIQSITIVLQNKIFVFITNHCELMSLFLDISIYECKQMYNCPHFFVQKNTRHISEWRSLAYYTVQYVVCSESTWFYPRWWNWSCHFSEMISRLVHRIFFRSLRRVQLLSPW